MAWTINAPQSTGGRYIYAPRAGEERLIVILDSEPYQRKVRGTDGKDRFTVTFAVSQLDPVTGTFPANQQVQLLDATHPNVWRPIEAASKAGTLDCTLFRLHRDGAFVEIAEHRQLTSTEIELVRDIPVTTTVRDLVEPPETNCPFG